MNDLEALKQYLISNPSDLVARNALADIYEEMGKPNISKKLRSVVKLVSLSTDNPDGPNPIYTACHEVYLNNKEVGAILRIKNTAYFGMIKEGNQHLGCLPNQYDSQEACLLDVIIGEDYLPTPEELK